jgi:transposase InsO family protein
LLQCEEDQLKPIAYYSRATSKPEKNYHSYELEALAVVESLERFKYYIYGKKIKVITDCNALKTSMEKRELIPRIARWWLRIQEFDIEIVHRPGTQMNHVDALSRAPSEDAQEVDTACLKVSKAIIDEADWLFSIQLQDKKIQKIVTDLKLEKKTQNQDYVIEHDRLFRKYDSKLLWIVPKQLRFHILYECHDKAGHMSVDKTISRISNCFWFLRMRNFVKSYIKSCVGCALYKTPGGRHEGQYHYDDINPVPFSTIHMDHLGPFPKSIKRNEHILVIVDAFTKFTIVRAVKSTATKHVLDILQDVTSYLGMPDRIITDHGTAFTSKDFEKYCKTNNVKHVLNAVRTPRANGHAERTNRIILSMLLPTNENEKRWDENMCSIQWSINTMINSTTKCSPFQLLYGYEPRDILKNTLTNVIQGHDQKMLNSTELEELRVDAAAKINGHRANAKKRYDARHSKPTIYSLDDLVLVENEPSSTGTSRKLEPRYKGPFIVKKVLPNDRYLVEDLPHSQRKQRHYTSVYSFDKMKRWCELPPDDPDEDDDQEDEFNPDFREDAQICQERLTVNKC